MNEDQRRLVRVFVQSGRQPIQLLFSQVARRGQRLFQRIQNEPIRARSAHQSDLSVCERALGGFLLFKNFPESFAVIVIAQSQMNWHLLRAYRLQQLRDRRIISFFATIECAIASDKESSRRFAQSEQLARYSREMFGLSESPAALFIT